MKVLVTGANGHLGRRLIKALPADVAVAAVVRSERARRVLERHVGDRAGCEIHLLDPADAAALAGPASGCDRALHLIGTIRETHDNRYADSHERPAAALASAAAAAGIGQLLYVSIIGAGADSGSACLRARATVEALFADAAPPAVSIRVPMVLGERDRASLALARRAHARRVWLFRGASLEQPIYAGDVVAALANTLAREVAGNELWELAGPESLPRAELVRRAAALVGGSPAIVSLPLALGMALAGLAELSGRGVTRDMLRILDHDDRIDPAPAAAALGVSLTPLDDMLRRCVVGRLER
ncbi:MAG: NAD(P)H-binding protein [Gammaproteobacteria bacterium]